MFEYKASLPIKDITVSAHKKYKGTHIKEMKDIASMNKGKKQKKQFWIKTFAKETKISKSNKPPIHPPQLAHKTDQICSPTQVLAPTKIDRPINWSNAPNSHNPKKFFKKMKKEKPTLY